MQNRPFTRQIFCGVIFATFAFGQGQLQPPNLALSNPGSQSGYSSNTSVTVTVNPLPDPPAGVSGWCLAAQVGTLTTCPTATTTCPMYSTGWITNLPASVPLNCGNGSYTVVLQYETPFRKSPIASAPIVLDTTSPTIGPYYAPAGMPGTVTGGQQQMLSTNAQFVTGSVTDTVTQDPVTITLDACPSTGSCTQFQEFQNETTPYIWNMLSVTPGSSDFPLGTTSIKITAVNAAGNQTSAQSTIPFATFTSGGLTPITNGWDIICGPATSGNAKACPALASAANPMLYDSPSAANGSNIFSGYADPSMRRDPVIAANNTNGTNLWMLYSYPEIQPLVADNCTPNTPTRVVEIHLGISSTSGSQWAAWCSAWPQSCSSETPIFPSVCTSANQYSSHEVANFWPSNATGTWAWYAVHLMYFVPPGGQIQDYISDGCLVTTVASTPGGLGAGWSNPPVTCTPTEGQTQFPSGNVAIQFSDLNTWSGQSCTTWGEAAILVQNTADTPTAYLAASCFGAAFKSQGYFIFTNTNLTGTSPLSGAWTKIVGPLTLTTLQQANEGVTLPTGSSFLTEFDWAQRADGSLVGIVTPASVSTSETQYGCIAVNLTPLPDLTFGSIVATLDDQDPNGSPPENATRGPAGCTYEPTSNTGMLIVRAQTSGASIQQYSLIETGIMP
jgi:hypothetical protein